jgi:hypothetical protein
MRQNYKAMSRKQQLFRLYEGYSALLENARQHRTFIVAQANSLTPEKYQQLLKNADDDIAFARAKLNSMIPSIPVQTEAKPVQVTPLHSCTKSNGLRRLPEQATLTQQDSQAQHAPEIKVEEQTGHSLETHIITEPSPVKSEAQSGAMPEVEHSDSVGWAIAGIAGIVCFSVGVPLFIKWINKDPQRNLAQVRDFLNTFKNA